MIFLEQNYKLTIAYDGTRFFGWERQPGKDTIQGKLESVLSRLQGRPVEVTGAGRTDAGVHARAMTANAVLDVAETPEAIRDYLNRYLPDAIAVREVKEAAPRFHARYKALGKTYRYVCFDGPVKPVFDRKYVTLLDFHPDLERMQQAAAYLQGEHDFASFCGNPRMKKSTVRLVDSITVVRQRDRIVFTFHGTGFLQNMVRILVGTLLEVGRGARQPEDMPALLEALPGLPENVKLLLPGSGALLDDCRAQAASLGVADRTVFPGQVHDMPRWLAAADIAISSSRSEGLPFNIMEAMACGLPAAASAVKGHTDLIGPENGLLFPRGDEAALAAAVRTLAEDAGLRARLGQAGREKMQRYALDTVLPQVMERYLSVTGDKGKRI